MLAKPRPGHICAWHQIGGPNLQGRLGMLAKHYLATFVPGTNWGCQLGGADLHGRLGMLAKPSAATFVPGTN